MSLKENLLKVIESSLELAKEAPQTIEVRSAIKQLQQAHGSISHANIVEEKKEIKKEVKKEPSPTKKDAKKGGVQKK